MSGIAGTVDLRPGLVSAKTLAAAMTDALAHRGPDGVGLLVDPPVALGHRRLSIFNPSRAPQQPLASEDGAFWLVLDGDVVNHVEVARDLRALGRRVGGSDAETVLQAWAQWGEACLDRLNGTFALAVWDRRRTRLVCARDRFGLKPLYYTTAGGRFRFASEIKALLVDADVPRRPNGDRVAEFLGYGLTDHTAETMLAGIRPVPAASLLVVTPDAGITECRRWYRLEPAVRDGRPVANTVRELLEDAVALRLRGDVPLGASVSGGLDSTAVFALAARACHADGEPPPDVFTARTRNAASDEWGYAEPLVRGAGGRSFEVSPDDVALVAEMDDLVRQLDEPCHSLSVFGHWKVMELARAHGAVVVLEGQAGDRFAGHEAWYPHVLYDLARHGRVRAAVREAVGRERIQGVPALRSALDLAKLLAPNRLRAREVPSWLGRDLAPRPPLPRRGVLGVQLSEYSVWDLPQTSREVDRDSARFGVESRSPFLDHRVVEYGLSLGAAILFRGGWVKASLRDAMRGILPPEILDRRDKQGFTVDQSAWFEGAFGALAEETLRSERAGERGYWEPGELLTALAAARTGRGRPEELWRAFAVERWLELVVDPPGPPAPGRVARPAVDALVRPAGESVVV